YGVGERATERLGPLRKLQHLGALQVTGAVQARGQDEMALEEGAGVTKELKDVVWCHGSQVSGLKSQVGGRRSQVAGRRSAGRPRHSPVAPPRRGGRYNPTASGWSRTVSGCVCTR